MFLDGDNIVFCLGEPARLCSIREKRRSNLQEVLVDAKLGFSDSNCEIGEGVGIEESSCPGLVLAALSAVKRGVNTHRSWRKTRVWICRLPWRSLARSTPAFLMRELLVSSKKDLISQKISY